MEMQRMWIDPRTSKFLEIKCDNFKKRYRKECKIITLWNHILIDLTVVYVIARQKKIHCHNLTQIHTVIDVT